MIPKEVEEIAELILPEFSSEADDPARVHADAIKTAWQVYNAGYRQPEAG